MNDDLIRAFRQTLYKVFDPEGAFVMQIDVPCPALRRCHARHGVESSVFITAWNPGSKVMSDAVNAAAQQRLKETLANGGYLVLDGQGEAPDGAWIPEASFLALGVNETEARRLCREFGQLAVIYSGADAVPGLLVEPGSKDPRWTPRS